MLVGVESMPLQDLKEGGSQGIRADGGVVTDGVLGLGAGEGIPGSAPCLTRSGSWTTHKCPHP